MKLQIVKFKYNGKFGLRSEDGGYYDSDFNIHASIVSQYKHCQFEKIEEVEDLLVKLKMEVEVLKEIYVVHDEVANNSPFAMNAVSFG